MAQLSSLHFWHQLNRCQVQKKKVNRTSSSSKLNTKGKVFLCQIPNSTTLSCAMARKQQTKSGSAHILWANFWLPTCVHIKKNPTKQNILIKGIKKKMLSKLTQNCHLLFFLKQVLTFKLGVVQWLLNVSPWIRVICCALQHLWCVWNWWNTSSSKSTTQSRLHWTFFLLFSRKSLYYLLHY